MGSLLIECIAQSILTIEDDGHFAIIDSRDPVKQGCTFNDAAGKQIGVNT